MPTHLNVLRSKCVNEDWVSLLYLIFNYRMVVLLLNVYTSLV